MRTRMMFAVTGALAAMLALAAVAEANCGPGPLVLTRKSALFQSFAATTNASFLPTQTAAITLGTSGCSSSGIVQMRREAEAFVVTNADVLERDLARGHGDYLQAMASLAGCPVESGQAFARAAQASFGAFTASPVQAPGAWLDQLGAGLHADPALAGTCRLFS